jgi:cytochrome c oxidase cbb3-type subunit 2
MSESGLLFPGIFASFALSLGATVLLPFSQLGGLSPDFKSEDGLVSEIYPIPVQGLPQIGKQVYVAEGCQACHTQFIRGVEVSDIDRGWGERRTVARDYVSEKGSPLGSLRIGPDLSNVGSAKWRNEPLGDPSAPAKRDASWHLRHLYNPKERLQDSNMPSYRHLFETRKQVGAPSSDALFLSGEAAPEPGYEVVPTASAKALVAYLGSLDRSHPLKEAGAGSVASQKK